MQHFNAIELYKKAYTSEKKASEKAALIFLIGGVVAYFSADVVDMAYLLPFAAGNFIYIASADLIPELATHRAGRDKLETTASLLGGLAILYAATWIG